MTAICRLRRRATALRANLLETAARVEGVRQRLLCRRGAKCELACCNTLARKASFEIAALLANICLRELQAILKVEQDLIATQQRLRVAPRDVKRN